VSVSAQTADDRLPGAGAGAVRSGGSAVEQPDGRLEALLVEIQRTLGPVALAAWTADESAWVTAAVRHYDVEGVLTPAATRTAHDRLVRHVATTMSPTIVDPHSKNDEGENPTDFYWLLIPLVGKGETAAVVECLAEASASDRQLDQTAGVLSQFGAAAAGLAAAIVEARRTTAEKWTTSLQQFTADVLSQDGLDATAYVAAAEIARLVEAERVTIVRRRGREVRTLAVSGQDLFDRRSGGVRKRETAARLVAAAGEAFWSHRHLSAEWPPPWEEALGELHKESRAPTIAILPLRTEAGGSGSETSGRAAKPAAAAGAAGAEIEFVLVVEFASGAGASTARRRRLEALAGVAVRGLGGAARRDAVFLLPVWKKLGQAAELARGRGWTWKKALLATAFLTVVGLAVVPWEFHVTVDGTLEPVVRRRVFAETTGTVQKVLVATGETVAPGEALVELRDLQLEVDEADLLKQFREAEQELGSLRRAYRETPRIDAAERNRLTGRMAALEEQLTGLARRQALLAEKRKLLTVVAPTGGQVITWDPENTLLFRPVEPGQVLVEIAQVDGTWELDVRIPEHLLGHVVEARRERPELPVMYVPATRPDHVHEGKLAALDLTAAVDDAGDGSEGGVVHGRVALGDVRPERLQAGAHMQVRIRCGERALGYVLFGDVIEYFRRRWWVGY
jgi:hypothetical protein